MHINSLNFDCSKCECLIQLCLDIELLAFREVHDRVRSPELENGEHYAAGRYFAIWVGGVSDAGENAWARDSFSQNMARIFLEDTSQCQTLLNILAAESENSIVS
jgi:hypothetical protein